MKQDVLHLKSPVNWINDPNGFIYYKGKYHLFYQHFPYAPIWGTMHWGHAVSEDLVHWEHKKIALFPTKSYDRNGVFSGSAIEKDEKLYFYYSAVRYLEQDEENIHLSKNDQFETSQAMLISEDGEKFDNWNGKKQIIPVIRDEEIADARDTRDPKVWKEDEKYYMVLGSTYHGKQARVLIFESEDGENWNYKSQCRKETYGHTMECPDLFKIREQYVFIGSPMGIQNDGLEYANQSVCTLAKFDAKTGELSLPDEYQMVDYGGDFYAPQSNLDKDGRRVMIAWMRMPKPVESKDGTQWTGMMCLPRVVGIKNGQVTFEVHPNVKENFEEIDLTKSVSKLKEKQPLWITTTLSEGEELEIGGYEIRLEDGTVVGNRERVFADIEGYHVENQTPKVGKSAKLDIFVEENLIEIFVNDGQYVLSHVVYGLGDTLNGKIQKVRVLK